jgi:hypothetical protein
VDKEQPLTILSGERHLVRVGAKVLTGYLPHSHSDSVFFEHSPTELLFCSILQEKFCSVTSTVLNLIINQLSRVSICFRSSSGAQQSNFDTKEEYESELFEGK